MSPLQTSSETVLQVKNLGKEYRIYASPRQRLKSLITGRSHHRSHWALKDVSFELRRGQCIGVIGDNGAGKSSLLKLLAGTLQPSTGSIERVGRVTAILELGAGFHPDFSGRDNLYFGGSLIGIDRETMQRLEPEIIEFSELGHALDRPVKTYSSGMAVRLAFALVTAVQPDVLIIDEALAVGRPAFPEEMRGSHHGLPRCRLHHPVLLPQSLSHTASVRRGLVAEGWLRGAVRADGARAGRLRSAHPAA